MIRINIWILSISIVVAMTVGAVGAKVFIDSNTTPANSANSADPASANSIFTRDCTMPKETFRRGTKVQRAKPHMEF